LGDAARFTRKPRQAFFRTSLFTEPLPSAKVKPDLARIAVGKGVHKANRERPAQILNRRTENTF
jgi:hypothetical protein